MNNEPTQDDKIKKIKNYEAQKRWRKRHPEVYRQRSRAYYKKHKAEINRKRRENYARNKDEINRLRREKRNALKNAQQDTVV